MLVVLMKFLLVVQYELLMYCQYDEVEQEEIDKVGMLEEVDEAEMLLKQKQCLKFDVVIVQKYENDELTLIHIVLVVIDVELHLIEYRLYDDDLDDEQFVMM